MLAQRLRRPPYFPLCVALAMAAAGLAVADGGDAPAIYKRHCIDCHAAMTGGDGRVLYGREPSREQLPVRDKRALHRRVDFCQRSLALEWTAEEISAVSDYLNREFYRFP